MKIEFHVKTLERERQILVEYVKRLESKLGDKVMGKN